MSLSLLFCHEFTTIQVAKHRLSTVCEYPVHDLSLICRELDKSLKFLSSLATNKNPYREMDNGRDFCSKEFCYAKKVLKGLQFPALLIIISQSAHFLK